MEKLVSTAGFKLTAKINTVPVSSSAKPEAAAIITSFTLNLFSLNTQVVDNLDHHSLWTAA